MLKMKSISQKMKKDKRGVLGLDTATSFLLGILTMTVIAFALIIALSNLNSSNALTPGSKEANDTNNIILNVTDGTATLFSNAGTWFSLLAVVVIILIIAVVIVAVNQFSTTSRGGL